VYRLVYLLLGSYKVSLVLYGTLNIYQVNIINGFGALWDL